MIKLSYTLETVKNDANSRGYELLSTKLGRSKDKLRFKCSKGHIFESLYYNFKKGHGCLQCCGKKKLDIVFVNKYIKSFGYTLISEEYKNAKSKLKVSCPSGHEYEICFDEFRSGKRCGKCVGGVRLELEYVRQQFINRGYTPLFNKYKKVSEKLPYLCPSHSEETSYIRYDSFAQGHGCQKCAVESRSGEKACNWKGGITPLISYIRENYLLEWRKESMRKHGFKCIIENTDGDLVIHHLYKGFTEILRESLEHLNLPLKSNIGEYTEHELESIGNKCVELHSKYGFGIPLKNDIHKKFHIIYGYGNNTYEQFKEFCSANYNLDIDKYFSFTE